MKKEQLIHYNEALAEYLRRCHEDVCGVPWADTIYPIRLSIKKEHDLYYEDWETYHRKNLLANALRQQLMEQALWGNMDELPFDERKQADQKREESFRKLVVSEKGAGRTSLCRKIALAYVSDISSYKKEYHLTGKLTPVLLSGRCFDGREDSTDFADIAYQMFLCEVENISEEDFCAVMKEKARAGELIVLIDGMDEIAKGQSAFLSALSSFLDEYPKTRLIITMETPDFSDPENLNLIMRLEKEERTDILLVDPLSEEEICDFVRYWCRAVCPEKKNMAEDIIQKLSDPSADYMKGMVRNPSHLTDLLLYIRENGSFPENRVVWFQYYTGKVFGREGQDGENFRNILSYLAQEMVKQKICSIRHDELVNTVIEAYRQGKLCTQYRTESDVERAIGRLEGNSHLLRKCSLINDDYSFAYPFLQDYLCAYRVVSDSRDCHDIEEFLKEYGPFNSSRCAIDMICMLIKDDPFLCEKVKTFLTEKVKADKDNYYYSNILFDVVCQGFPMERKQKEEIYECLFCGQITDTQIEAIRESMNTDYSKDFRNYIVKQHNKEMKKGESEYSLAAATIEIFRCSKEGKRPLEEAERLILQEREDDIILGLNMITLIGWCRYSHIPLRIPVTEYRLSTAVTKRMKEILLEGKLNRKDIVNAIRDAVFARLLLDRSLMDKTVFDYCTENYDSNKKEMLKLLSCFPITEESIEFHRGKDLSRLQDECLSDYCKAMAEENVADAFAAYNVCVLLGV